MFDKVDQVLSSQNFKIFTTAQIKQLAEDNYGLNKSSVIPSDYCYNRINEGIGFDKNILIYLGFGEFLYVGKSYKYKGLVFQKTKGEREDKIVGKWHDGVYHPIQPRFFRFPDFTLSNASELNQVQIEKLYQNYLELLELEQDLLGCQPTELRHLIGRIGEFKCALLTNGKLSSVPNQHGFDVISEVGKKISVKTTAQQNSSDFYSINANTVNLFDELMLIQLKDGEFSVVYYGDISPAIEVARKYRGKYELGINKASNLVSYYI